MNKHTFYKVSWTSGGRAEEGRRFDEWEPAAEFYADVAADRRCDRAALVEVVETEVRCFEREAGRMAPERPAVVRGGVTPGGKRPRR